MCTSQIVRFLYEKISTDYIHPLYNLTCTHLYLYTRVRINVCEPTFIRILIDFACHRVCALIIIIHINIYVCITYT